MTWKDFIEQEQKKDYYQQIISFLQEDAKTHTIYPDRKDIFTALKLAPLEKIRVVCLGQDPYIGVGQAHGLAFSVKTGVSIPPSLKNIFKEIKDDLGLEGFNHGCLESWAQQGVLLLNSTLTVREGQSNSHKDIGWTTFTDAAISLVNQLSTPVVFMLWGASAKKKKSLITNPIHLILEAAHPSPLSAHNGFFGCKHFSKTNEFLTKHGYQAIDWSL